MAKNIEEITATESEDNIFLQNNKLTKDSVRQIK
jgi:hypothetical protein|tara:strand:+ start:365 stop:466 length:102 start_codon:yes stop_codon:yes gene_type:complete